MKGPLASLFVSALLVGWFAPTLTLRSGPGDAAPMPDDPAAERRRLDLARNEAWLAGDTVLQRQADGHFYARAHIDGTQVRFLVDTGASIVALTGEDAMSLGLSWDDGALRPIGRGASGTVYGTPVLLPSLEVGGFEATNVEAAIIPDGLDVSLLGQSFLSRIENVEISGDTMRLGG